ncbi:S-adenosyl-L-methionine-dependent methyltransferase [Lindgomyces ingoldianus]|uniref:S-adenosyl-L-methionine-dependent methyltransferase n=1 Tax=Lindgomyces ingoldianus TaxID=673940 RepID=A0ACB6QCU5_9PLEO|nr:S-adenosyl-L-methionine-dependent methyltransferase [Lindgomyces ingoldianus]KAF2464320.1 S-adenosyl-L-methionine-dependent methyltransferase [Lindgomyces ingoldianus]
MSSRPKATPRKPKAAKEAEKQARQLPTSTILKNVARAAVLLILAGVASPVSQLSLSPVYGSIPASLHHQRSITFTALLALVGKGAITKYLPANISEYIAIIAYWTPVLQFLLFYASGRLGVDYGPLLIESVTYLPLLLLSVYTASDLLDTLDLSRFNLNPTITEMVPPLASYITVSSVSKITASILPSFVGTHLSFTRVGLQLLIGSVSAILTPSRVILFAAPAILHTMLANPHYPSESALQKANTTLFSTQNFTLLARQESVTGYVSVLESHTDAAFRLLRCDHSLLGGEWLVTPAAAAKGQTQRETIFSVFVMLEAVRLVEDDQSDVEPIPDNQKSALVIGLGIGTAPNALMSHGINTTIVELDPVVHHYASKFFNLSPNHTAVIDDAVAYVHEKSKTNPNSFNYIIHDVFTGGAEPVYLFTQEFFKGLASLLKEDGIVAINYAGDLSLPSTRLVLNTIHSVFPACRLFRDSPPAGNRRPSDPDFINMVVYCVKNDHDKGKFALLFREADEDDFKGSIARQNFLRPKEELEIQFDYEHPDHGGQVMKKSDVGELEKWHKQGAVSHWRIMRTVLPDAVWEMW